MRSESGQLLLSATDLANHLACRHLTALDRASAEGTLEPPFWHDPDLDVLIQRGLEHERAYLEHLSRQGFGVHRLPGDDPEPAAERTRSAMREGHDVIVQATLMAGRWHGRADVLRRVDRASELGPWSYEVVDTKLARETRAGTILQLCLYSDLVCEIQGVMPEAMHVVAPRDDFDPETYRTDHYLAYYRFVRRRLEAAVDGERAETYPDPVPHCDVCRWWKHCDERRRKDDHLSLVAGISALQRGELDRRGVGTLAGLAAEPVPIEWKPSRGSREGLERVGRQAQVQLRGRRSGRPVHELLDLEPGRGLHRLPEPSDGDVFFDIEGDPFVGRAGLEYLLGWVARPADGALAYTALWASRPDEERRAFETFVDFVTARRAAHPDLHVYHFGHYEPTALKRLMGAYATREDEIDRWLRAGLFVDLHRVVKESLRASVEQYSIKDLEAFFGYRREQPLREASLARQRIERALELDQPEALGPEARDVVEKYNRDDCMATLALREWLERLRGERLDAGAEIHRPAPASGDPTEKLSEKQQRVQALMSQLLAGVPAERAARSEEQHARWLLAHLLDYHWRELKAPLWERYRLRELTPEQLLDERDAISGLEFVERLPGKGSRPIDRYRYPRQETSVRERKDLHVGEIRFGKVVAIDVAARTIDVEKDGKAVDLHPECVFVSEVFFPGAKEEALFALGESVARDGIDADGPHRAARDLLLNRAPRLTGAASLWLEQPGENTVAAARRLAPLLDRGVLGIQGPPGAGKTFTGARMICDLVRLGRKVGITAVSHKVIRNLIDQALDAARADGPSLACVQKISAEDEMREGGPVLETRANEDVIAALREGSALVGAGTAWMWAREEFRECVDVLFVDEAGQMCLADVVGAGLGAKNIVLLGDPRQLEQPQQGSHPDGTDVSALEHLLEGAATMPASKGLFLPETWRLHDSICEFTSELFYEGRLEPMDAMKRQTLTGPTRFAGAGLWFVPVHHAGNQNASQEEAERIDGIVGDLVREGVGWIDHRGSRAPLTLDDVLVIAPYNAQVADLVRRLPAGARVGTVDRFQGQEAPVVVYSMTTSSPEDAPRGMEFLYSLNRFNVATSRARCACILVASPRLLEPECRTPRHMLLANALCRYAERATLLDG
jgi:uncharacterized protein